MSALAAESPTTVPTNSAEPLIRVEDVHTYYGKSHILHGVSLNVRAGEVVGLLGRNGVGKSTTLKSIMGLVRPSHGTVMLNGNAITGLPPHKLARMGIAYVPEDRRIFRFLTVMENLRTGFDRDGAAFWETFVTGYGPTKALASGLDESRRAQLKEAFVAFHEGYRTELGISVPRAYLITLGRRK